jgi:tetratricopeptide (TPR) repeat protein
MRPNRLITITFLFALALTACHKRVPITALPPAPSAPPAPSPAAAALDEADNAFNAGRYDEATRGYENYFRLTPSTGPAGQRDQALFRLGLAYALRSAPDWQKASVALRQIMEGFPNSPYKAPANLILSLHSELDQLTANSQQRDQRIKQLTTELDRLKRIDAERRKRP